MAMNRAPSVNRLEAAFPGKGKALRALLKGEVKTDSYESVRYLLDECHHRPSYAHRLMTALNEILEGYGVETLYKGPYLVAEYVNMGDTYNTTIIRNYDTGSILITCMGDYVTSNRL